MSKTVEFIPASKPHHITFDHLGTMYYITKMFDQFAEETTDHALAVSCVIEFGPDGPWQSASCDDVPIYPVH